MKMSFPKLGALVVFLSVTNHIIAGEYTNPAMLADGFVTSLQKQRFQDAADMFAPQATADTTATARSLKRIAEHVGGYSGVHPVGLLPTGTSVKVELPRRESSAATARKSFQFRYAATANDGKPVFYVLDITADEQPPRVMSFALHIPASDAQSAKRAAQLLGGSDHWLRSF